MRRGIRARDVWCVLALLSVTPVELVGQTAAEPLVAVVVRHAEKADDDPRDPTLTPDGVRRAEALARMVSDLPLRGVWSSDYHRTRNTAAPTARAHGLELRSYDPSGRHDALVASLVASGGHHLVVGHSNTVPALVRALGGDPGPDIADSEYDRLYVVTRAPGGSVSTTLLRFGPPRGSQDPG